MFERIVNIFYYIVLILVFISMCALFVFMHGWWGILTAIGFFVVAVLVMALFESVVKYIATGVWEFTSNQDKRGQD